MKEGIAQQLLTGQTRLPGFTAPWKSVKISDFATFRKGTAAPANQPGNVPVMAAGKQYAGTIGASNRSYPVITVSSSGASAGFVSFHKISIWASDCFTIESNDLKGVDLYFFFHLLQSMQNKIYALQSGGAQPHVYSVDLGELEVFIPVDRSEQQAIAQVLSDMDAEIAALEAKLAKVRLIKEGMMQELLSGRTRLPVVKED